MAKEIERKFLVKNTDWKKYAFGILYKQGYLSTVKERTVRVRIVGENAFLTIKGATTGISRSEFEYQIPLQDANIMLDELCEKPLIEKYRYKIVEEGTVWEIDEFLGENAGLIIAEVELANEEQDFVKPSWLGIEVSNDLRYFNANLVTHPYKYWAA